MRILGETSGGGDLKTRKRKQIEGLICQVRVVTGPDPPTTSLDACDITHKFTLCWIIIALVLFPTFSPPPEFPEFIHNARVNRIACLFPALVDPGREAMPWLQIPAPCNNALTARQCRHRVPGISGKYQGNVVYDQFPWILRRETRQGGEQHRLRFEHGISSPLSVVPALIKYSCQKSENNHNHKVLRLWLLKLEK